MNTTKPTNKITEKCLLLLVLFLLSFANAHSQELTLLDMEIVKEGNLTQKEYWINLKSWISSTFSNYMRVVDMEDAESGTLIMKVTTDIPVRSLIAESGEGYFSSLFTIRVDCRDNKYRIQVNNISGKHTSTASRSYAGLSNSFLRDLVDEMNIVIGVSNAHFNGSQTWPVDNNYINILSDLDNEVSLLENELSQIDQSNKKNIKAYNAKEGELSKIQKERDLLADIYTLSRTSIAVFADNLISSMDKKDDF